MPELTLEIEYQDGEIRQGSTAHWPHAFPRKPIAHLCARQGQAVWEIDTASEYCVYDPPPRGPLMILALNHRGRQLWGRVWTFAANRATPEVTVIDGEPLDAPGLPPRSRFIPGAFAEFVPPARRSSATAVRSRR